MEPCSIKLVRKNNWVKVVIFGHYSFKFSSDQGGSLHCTHNALRSESPPLQEHVWSETGQEVSWYLREQRFPPPQAHVSDYCVKFAKIQYAVSQYAFGNNQAILSGSVEVLFVELSHDTYHFPLHQRHCGTGWHTFEINTATSDPRPLKYDANFTEQHGTRGQVDESTERLKEKYHVRAD